jgi:hypothetical protein
MGRQEKTQGHYVKTRSKKPIWLQVAPLECLAGTYFLNIRMYALHLRIDDAPDEPEIELALENGEEESDILIASDFEGEQAF